MNKKYELTDETLEWKGHILHRIKALRDFGDVKAGDLGGWIESEDNLSHEGDCWVADEAVVCGKAKVGGKACVFGHGLVCGDAQVFDYAQVFDFASIFGEACICGHAKVFDYAQVFDFASIFGEACICGNAMVYGKAKVGGNAYIFGVAEITGNAFILGYKDYAVFKNFWSSGRFFTWTRSNNMWKVGCFYGTGDELIVKAYKDSELSGKCYEAIVKAVESVK